MKKRLLSMFLCLCMLLTMVPAALAVDNQDTPDPQTTQTEENTQDTSESLPTADEDGIIKLTQNVTLSNGYTVNSNETVTIDLNGYTLTANIICKGTLTVKDSTASNPAVERTNDADKITYSGGKITSSNGSTLYVTEGGQATVESGMIEATGGNIAAAAEGTITQNGEPVASSLTINGGFIEAKEFAASAQGKGAILTVNGGVLHAKDNAVVAGNGTNSDKEYRGGTTININGGTMIGNITSEGFVACGVYHPQAGTLNITGGTIITSGGVGVLMRGGQLNMTGGNIEVSGTATTGKVGDSTQSVGCYGVQVDGMSNYYDYTNCKVMISGGSVTATGEDMSAVAHTVAESGSNVAQKVFISGGSFSSTVENYLATGYTCAKDDLSGQYVVSVANGAQVDATTDKEGNVSATVDGNYSGNEDSTGEENSGISTENGKVTIDVSSDKETTTGTTAEITVGSNALTSINDNNDVKKVELKTDVGTLTIDKGAWNSMKTEATTGDETASVVIKLEDKSKEGSNPVYEVTATVGEENAFDGDGLGSVTISVPFSAANADTAKVFCIDSGKLEDMHAKVSGDDNKTLTWSTTHFSSFGVVPYSNSNEPEVFYTQASESDTQAQGGEFSEAASSVGQNGGAIMLNKDVTGSLTVAKEKTVILDLNGHKLTNDANAQDKSHTITNNGTLTITDSSDSKAGTVDNVSHGKGALVNNEGATATLEAGTLTRSDEAGTSTGANGNSWYVVDNSGTLIVNSGAVKNDSGYSSLVRNMGTMTVNGGSFENTFIAIKNDEDGESKRGQLTISGGTVVSKSGDAVQNWSTATITGDAVIKGDVGTWAYKSGDTIFAGTTTVSGGVIEGDVSAGIYGLGTLGENPQSVPDVTISDKAVVNGNVTYNHSGDAATTGIYGNIKINGGTVNGNVCNPADKGEISMTGGTVTGNVVNQNTGEVSISGGMVKGAVTNENKTGEITVTGGTFTTADVSDFVSKDAAITITFDPNGGTCAVKTMILTKKDGSAKVETLPIPTRSGQYDFDGWYTASSGGTKVAENETSFNENTTLYAHWNYTGGGGGGGGSVTTKYTLTFDTNGGSAIAKVTKEKGTTVDLEQYVPTREGYTFAGWYSDEALTQKVTSVKLNANTTVYAKWTENAVTPTLPFTDVKSGDWFYEAVQYVYDKGMMTGVSADRFAPASTTTRGMIVTILYRLENEPAVSGGSAFTDVESGAWYANAVTWAAANDIVNGTSATTFAPNSPITREQMAAILYRYAAYKGYDVSQKADLSGYTDAASISGYAKDALAWANAQKLITGVTDTTLNPQGSATRAQVATILMRLCETVVK